VEQSILKSTKEVLGLPPDYEPFDLTILTHISSAMSSLAQLGVGPSEGITVDGPGVDWSALGLPDDQLNMVKVYVFLKVKFLFDPPQTQFLIQAVKDQLAEHEWRLQRAAEALIPLPVVNPTRPLNLSIKETPEW
jgi:hypothetical protein